MKLSSKLLIFVVFIVTSFLSPFIVQVETSNKNLNTTETQETKTYEHNVSLGFSQAYAEENEDASFLSLDCDWLISSCSFKNAMLTLFEFFWYRLTQTLAALAGTVLDFMLNHSISSNSYRSGIIEAGWEILRDITNIIFIFALLISAFGLVLNIPKIDSKKLLVKTILVALVINFSLFVTYFVVDTSNLLAHTFYNRINVEGKAEVAKTPYSDDNYDEGSLDEYFQENETKSVSLAVISQFNPQKIIASANVGKKDFGQKLFIVFIAGALNILLIYIFISVAFLFLGRTIGIMLLGIFAPVAFGTLTLPNATKIPWVGFNTWWKQLTELAFSAPIFLFLLYLTVRFATNSGILASMQSSNATSVYGTALNVILPFAIIATLLMMSRSVTKKLAGELGSMVVDYTKKLAGGAITAGAIVATGGAALAGGALRGAGSLASRVSTANGGSGALGRRVSQMGQGLQAQNFNFGSNKYIRQLGGMAGVNTTMGIGDRSLSYANVDTRARQGINNVRAGISDFRSGRPSDSLQQWQNNVQESRDQLSERREENAVRQAEQNVAGGEVGYDFGTHAPRGDMTGDVQGRIQELQAELRRRNSTEALTERTEIQTEVQNIRNQIQAEKDQLADLQRDRRDERRAGNTAAVATLDVEIQNRRDTLQNLERNIQTVENSSLEGRIQQLQTQLTQARDNARAQMYANDRQSRFTGQDSSFVINEERRQQRVDAQAARSMNNNRRNNNS